MKSRLSALTSLFAFVACSFFAGCANDASGPGDLDPGAKPNSPASGPAGIDGKAKGVGGKPAAK